MAGIYIHIPFCRQRCHYCDFYKTTQTLKKPQFIDALIKEAHLRKGWLGGEKISTIYFGGGTPSLLTADEIKRIIDAIYSNFNVDALPEITLEANPDDLTKSYIKSIKNTQVNRLSIGIQSFQDTQLVKMNRRHNKHQAIESVQQAQNAGFTNISTDLIYGLPQISIKQWEQDLEQMRELNIRHLSAYHLTYEPATQFGKMLQTGKLLPVSEDESIKQFKILIKWAKTNEFEHYEISNFAKSGFYSKHNTSYWQQQKYLGLGPSAHSYNVNSRMWNVSDIDKYLAGIMQNINYHESENLSDIDKYNEYLMTWMRTKWGVNLKKVGEIFGIEKQQELTKAVQPFIDNGNVFLKKNSVILSDKGIFISDLILTELMVLKKP